MDIIAYSFDGSSVRVLRVDGEPWFVLADVCKVLSIGNPSDAARRLDDDEKDTLDNIEGIAAAQVQQVTIINESGLYSLILTSRKEAAKRFKKWVTAEVLPAIRKTGSYQAPAMTREEQIAHALIASQQVVQEQHAKIIRLEPKALAYDRIADADGSMCITDAAKTLQVRPRDLFSWMRGNGWIYSRPGTSDIGRQEKINAGLLVHKVDAVIRTDGSEKVTTQVRVTPKGVTKLAAHFNQSRSAA